MPAYNEVESIEQCVKGVVEVLSAVGKPFEVIVVDDGSNDGTGKLMREFGESDARIRLISHGHNLGKTEAIKSGLAKSTGEIIVLMDADLQYDPHDIPKLTQLVRSGYDAVNGSRVDRKDGTSKKVASRFFNWMAGAAFNLNVKDFNSGLKAFRKDVLEDVELRGDYHRYILVAVKANGYRVGEVPITHYPRKFGRSKYGFKRLILGTSDLFSLKLETALSKRPMLLFGTLSASCLLIGVSAGVYSILTGGIGLRPAVLLSIGFILASIQFLSIGFVAELVLTVKEQMKKLISDIGK